MNLFLVLLICLGEAPSCSKHHQEICTTGYCLRSWRTHRHMALGEFECDEEKGRCAGFDPSAMLWVVCESMLTKVRLFSFFYLVFCICFRLFVFRLFICVF